MRRTPHPEPDMADDNPDLYDDGDGSAPAAEESPKEDSGDLPTFLVGKSALGGQVPEVGDTKQIRAVRVLDDQVEFVCEYPKSKSEDDDTEMAPPPPDDMMLE